MSIQNLNTFGKSIFPIRFLYKKKKKTNRWCGVIHKLCDAIWCFAFVWWTRQRICICVLYRAKMAVCETFDIFLIEFLCATTRGPNCGATMQLNYFLRINRVVVCYWCLLKLIHDSSYVFSRMNIKKKKRRNFSLEISWFVIRSKMIA